MYIPKQVIVPSQKPITLGPKLCWNWLMGSKQTVMKLADGIKAVCWNWLMGSKQTVVKLADGIKADCVEIGRKLHAYLVQRFPAVPCPHRAASWRWTEGRWCGSPAAHSGWTVNTQSSRIITTAALLQQNGKNRMMWWLVALHPLLLVQLKCPGFAGHVWKLTCSSCSISLSLSLSHTHTSTKHTDEDTILYPILKILMLLRSVTKLHCPLYTLFHATPPPPPTPTNKKTNPPPHTHYKTVCSITDLNDFNDLELGVHDKVVLLHIMLLAVHHHLHTHLHQTLLFLTWTQKMVYGVSMFYILLFFMNVHADTEAYNCTHGLFEHFKTVHTESWLQKKKNHLSHSGIKITSALHLDFQSATPPAELSCPSWHILGKKIKKGDLKSVLGCQFLSISPSLPLFFFFFFWLHNI